MRWLGAIALTYLLTGCYQTHGREGVPDADAPLPPPLPDATPPMPPPLPMPIGDLQSGVLYDNPEGRFREVILTREPIPCEAVTYSSIDATGGPRPSVVDTWLSLVHWAESDRQRSFLHLPDNNIGPSDATFEIPAAYDPGLAEVGEPVPVTYFADFGRFGRWDGVAIVEYCGLFVPMFP